jgi:hypothetical protein
LLGGGIVNTSIARDTDTTSRARGVFYVTVARQQLSKCISAAMNQHATIEELLEVVFSMQSLPRLYNEDQQQLQFSHELQVSSGSSWLAMSPPCWQPLPSND